MIVDQWADSLKNAMEALYTELATSVPNIISAILLLIVGYIISKLLQKTFSKLLKKVSIDRISEKVGIKRVLDQVGIKSEFSDIIGKVVFWFFMLSFVVSAADILHFENATGIIDQALKYIPNIIAASLIFILGLTFAQFVSSVIENAGSQLSDEYSGLLAKIVKTILVIIVFTISIEQLKIETALIGNIIQILLVTCGVVLSLSLGLGTKGLSKAILSGVYARDIFNTGSRIKFNDIEGELLQVGRISSTLKTSDGKKIHIPNSVIVESIVTES